MKMERQHGLHDGNKPCAVILAGGRSSRFGSDKAFASLEGKPLFEILADSLTRGGFSVVISTNRPKAFRIYPYPILADLETYVGPLFALYSIFMQLPFPRILLTACDMPFLTPEAASLLWEESRRYDVTVLCDRKKESPLPGVYSRHLFSSIHTLIRQGRKDLKALLQNGFSANRIAFDRWSSCDPKGVSLKNINTPQDLKKVA